MPTILTPESVQAVPALAQAKTKAENNKYYYSSIHREGRCSVCVCLSCLTTAGGNGVWGFITLAETI